MNLPIIKSLKFFVATAGVILMIGIIFYGFHFFSAPEPGAEKESFTIHLRTSELEIINKLYSQGYIRSRTAFNIVLTSRRWHNRIKPGGYMVSKNMSAFEMADILVNHPYQKWVVIPEGLRKEEIAGMLELRLNWQESQKEDFLLAVKEGYMFPETYLLNLDYSGEQAAKRLFNKFNEKFKDASQELLEQNIRNDTAIKIASLIQREAANEAEMPLISGIIWNRLLKPMPLEIDASLQYALGKSGSWWPVIKKKDYKLDSPYNLYLHKGHPPTPICSPGLAAIEAVIHPQETDYFYYLHDQNRQIHYAKTYEEHLENIKNYILLPAAEVFVQDYLDTYKNIEERKNYDEVKAFLTEEQLKYMGEESISFEQNFTVFDNYEILKVAEAENNPEADYIAQAKFYYEEEILKNPETDEIMEIYIVREKEDFKTPSWYFVPRE